MSVTLHRNRDPNRRVGYTWAERHVRPRAIVMSDPAFQQSSQMALIQWDVGILPFLPKSPTGGEMSENGNWTT